MVFKIVGTSVCFPLRQLRKKVSRAKENPSLQFLEYSTVGSKFKPKFEFQTLLAQNSPAGTSELIPFSANLDLCWNCPCGTSEFPPFSANLDLLWD